jgi:hypothetical protein
MTQIEQNPFVQQNNDRNLPRIFPNASKDFIDLNSQPSSANTQSGIRDGTLAEKKVKARDSRKRAVRITSYRVKLADVEGLCGKWHLDALRYAGLIHDDTEEDITYQITQKKVQKKNQEKTLIEIEICQ